MTDASQEHVTLRVPDIHSGRCINAIQESLMDVEGVSNVHASVETKFVDVDIDTGKVSTDQVVEILAEAGYPARR